MGGTPTPPPPPSRVVIVGNFVGNVGNFVGNLWVIFPDPRVKLLNRYLIIFTFRSLLLSSYPQPIPSFTVSELFMSKYYEEMFKFVRFKMSSLIDHAENPP